MRGMTELVTALKDDKVHIAIGKITSLHLADDNSFLKVKVEVYPEVREIVARMT